MTAGRHRPGAQLETLIKGPEVLEPTHQVDTVALGKTGTVATGKVSLVEVHLAGSISPQDPEAG